MRMAFLPDKYVHWLQTQFLAYAIIGTPQDGPGETMTHLTDVTSPYLLQHANNPVDWYPWGKDALERAQAEQKPIFLSIGYSACHWCHVMAHESFEDGQVAAILNEYFISVKVDREERPDLDQIYMTAVQAITGRGGWPLSVFLTPDGHPFYGGTYFPPSPRYGMPSFTQVLQAVVQAWQDRRWEIINSGLQLTKAVVDQSEMHRTLEQSGPALYQNLSHGILDSAFQVLKRQFDHVNGGWDSAPKFPQPMILEFLLRYHHTTGDTSALEMVTQTLEAMARGGVYDQLGGGFHRYSVDEQWLTPHFERMLYDQAQLARVYLHGWQVTQIPLHRAIAEEILDYVVREMTDPTGGFYSTQDADSEGEEGKFFLWTPVEIHSQLGEEAKTFMQAYGITRQGNFEGKNILTFTDKLHQRPGFARARWKLLEARYQRVPPGRDQKVLAAWNGLMLAAFAEAARILERPDYLQIAVRSARFLLGKMRQPDGRLWRSSKDGVARLNGYLEDYSCLIEGLLELYHTTFDPEWYQAAADLAEIMIAHFYTRDKGFFDTSDDHEILIARPRDLQDNATPSGTAMAATTLLRLAHLASKNFYVDLVYRIMTPIQPLLSRYPLGFGQWLQAASYALSEHKEIAIVGNPEAQNTRTLLKVAQNGYRPFQTVVLAASGIEPSTVPLLQVQSHQPASSEAIAYVCTGSTCQPPVTSHKLLRELLEKRQDDIHAGTNGKGSN